MPSSQYLLLIHCLGDVPHRATAPNSSIAIERMARERKKPTSNAKTQNRAILVLEKDLLFRNLLPFTIAVLFLY
jgi:hypothetical protein